MPRGVRTATNGFEEKNFPTSGSAVPENETKSVNLLKKVTVGTGVDPENVIRWDKDGAVLLFEQKENFLPLADAVVGQLSRENKVRYSMAKEFHDAWRGDEHAKLVEDFKVDKNLSGSATDKMQVEAPKGMHVRWCAPYNIEKYRALGYKVLSADEVRSFLGPKDGHHEIGTLGQTELVQMGIPMERYRELSQKTEAENRRKAGAWKTSGLNDVNRSGATGFVATDDDRRRWTETSQALDDGD